jgi:hypothetical protein
METKLELIRGNLYRTLDGGKVELLWIDPKCDMMLFIRTGTRKVFWQNAELGYISGPWREPAQVRVVMYRNHVTGAVRAWDEIAMSGFPPMDGWELIGEWTLTEGTGNVPA